MNKKTIPFLIIIIGCLLLGSNISTASSSFPDAYGIKKIQTDFVVNLFQEPCVNDELNFTITLDFYQFAFSDANKGEIESMKLDVRHNKESIGGKFPMTVTKADSNEITFSTSFSSPGFKKLTVYVDEDSIVWEDEPLTKNSDLCRSINFWVSDPSNEITKVFTDSFPIAMRLKTIFQQIFY